MSSRPQIVVSGVGTVSAAGLGADSLIRALDGGRARAGTIDRAEGFHAEGSSQTALLVRDLPLHRWVAPMAARRMSPPSRFAVAAARDALQHAGLEPPDEPNPALGVVLTTSFGPATNTQRLVEQILHEGPGAASPALFTECVANAATAQVAIHCRATGANYTLSGRESGPLQAVARAADRLRRGNEALALAGAFEEITPLLHAVLERFGALARPDEKGSESARPFDLRRCGFLAAAGASLLVLEPAEAAARRGARVLARLLSWSSAFDASASRVGWGNGVETLARGLRECLERAEMAPGDVDLIVSGASGSVQGDRLEALTLRHVWRTPPPIVAPKGVTGEYSGAWLAAAVLVAAGLTTPRTAGFAQSDPELGIVPHDGRPLADVRTVLVSALGSGGAASWILLGRP